MGFFARLMAGYNFWDLTDSNDVPHAQVGNGRRFWSQKAMVYSPCFLAGWGSKPDVDFYAWNRCLGVPGVSSWGPTARAAPGPPARGPDLAQASLFPIKGPVWALGPSRWVGPTFQT